jgi:hypothetical protein
MKSHRTDGVSLTFGVFFLALAVWYALARMVDLDLPAMGWSVAGALFLLGLLGLVGALHTGRSCGRAEGPAAAAPIEDPNPAGQPVTDTDRAPIAERLRAALDDGRLTFAEYNERLQQAYTALTYEELDRALEGLEAPHAQGRADGEERR